MIWCVPREFDILPKAYNGLSCIIFFNWYDYGTYYDTTKRCYQGTVALSIANRERKARYCLEIMWCV